MGEVVEHAAELLRALQVLALVVEDDVGLLVYASSSHCLFTGTASIRSEHDGVLRIATELALVRSGGQQLDVGTTAVNVLLVLGRELQHEILSLVVEHLVHLGRVTVELGVLRGLDALILGIAVPLAGAPAPLAHLLGLLPASGLHPSVFVA